ncbi:MAG: hypothetical protein OXJ90_18165 [Spirochaetaceae bacterium]|nr:hypothetical protein [Spirochaetaceae bacterium]
MFAAADGVECLDYGCSYLWPYDRPRDSVRVLIESRILLAGGPHGTGIPYYLGASCKGEDTYGVRKQYGPMGFRAGARTLFLDPNYDFTWIVGSGSAVIFRRALPDASNPAGAPGRYREVRADTSRTWGPLRLQLTPATGAYEIPVGDFAAVAAATDAGHGIVAQTEIADAGTGTRAVIEYPVKTMNVSRAGYPAAGDGSVWQTETGPIGVPDLSRRHDPPVACFSLGFIAVASRQPDAADFVLERPTALARPHADVSVLHFSAPFSRPATNRLFGIPPRAQGPAG